MRIPRIFTAQPLQNGAVIALEEQASQHLLRVLRMTEGAAVELFNGHGPAHAAQIHQAGKKQALLAIGEALPARAASPLDCDIAVAVSKGDKMDWIVQKCTELGVRRISPVTSQRSDVRLDASRWQKKQQHWQQVMISACEQCGRNDLADIAPVRPLADWLAGCTAASRLLLDPHQAQPFSAALASPSLALCFGPEGGFDDDEIRLAGQHGFASVTLGPRILRAETAPLAALAIAQTWFGDFAG